MSVSGEGSFRGTHARKLVWQSWSPAGDHPLKGVVTIAHGYGEHIGRYEYVAERLNEAGFAVYGLDHHGHGRSGGKKRGRISLGPAVADLDQLIVTVSKGQNPELPQFLLGHSLGGAIALRYAMAHQNRLTGLALSAPLAAVEGGKGLHTFARVLGTVLPGAPVSKVDPRLVSRDQAVVNSYIADPLNHHGPVPAGFARDVIVHVDSLARDVKQITLPTLLMWGTSDRLCPPSGSELVAAKIGSEDLTVKRYEGLFHEIMNEPERDQVLDDLVGWFGTHLPVAAA
ncbi:MAG TPA: alpha/beta hydrolase [Solirubrobacteraceae bacterium]|jgi:lysophospholipase|nr:alpha/beta hydrolase [Solirubrobacteraceae bacterium]